MVTFTLVIVGALNWGLAAFDYNVVHMLLGAYDMAEKAVYVLVALSGLYLAATHMQDCKMCSAM